MARTRGAEADPIEPTEEADLGQNQEVDAEVDEDVEGVGDEAGGDEGSDDEQEEGPEAEDDVDPEPAPRRGGGGSQTIKAQRARAQEAERRAVALERENAELRGFNAGAASRQPQADPQAQARAEQEFYAQLGMMEPAQAYQAIVNRERQNFGGALQQLRFEQQELTDRTEFAASCATSPTRAAYRERVEQYRAQQRRAGFVCGREEAFWILHGKDTEAAAKKAAPRQRQQAAARVAGQQTRPTGARSNIAPGGRRPAAGSRESDAALLAEAERKGLNVWDL